MYTQRTLPNLNYRQRLYTPCNVLCCSQCTSQPRRDVRHKVVTSYTSMEVTLKPGSQQRQNSAEKYFWGENRVLISPSESMIYCAKTNKFTTKIYIYIFFFYSLSFCLVCDPVWRQAPVYFHNGLLRQQISHKNNRISATLTEYCVNSTQISGILPATLNVSGDLTAYFVVYRSIYFCINKFFKDSFWKCRSFRETLSFRTFRGRIY